jgi:hypothetical protein
MPAKPTSKSKFFSIIRVRNRQSTLAFPWTFCYLIISCHSMARITEMGCSKAEPLRETTTVSAFEFNVVFFMLGASYFSIQVLCRTFTSYKFFFFEISFCFK